MDKSDRASQIHTFGAVLQAVYIALVRFVGLRSFSKMTNFDFVMTVAMGGAAGGCMKDGVVLDEALRRTRVSKSDLMAKLREANAINFSKVRAVVLETTGDVSVLHGEDVDGALLKGINQIE